MKIVFALAIFVALGFAAWRLYPRAFAVAISDEEINACAVEAAIANYRRGDETREDAIQSVIVDMGERPDIFAKAAAYKWTAQRTIYDKYLDDGRRMCIERKLRGEKISMPELKVRDGYHVMRWYGSAALVKDGEPEPVFGHPLPNGQIVWSDGQQH